MEVLLLFALIAAVVVVAKMLSGPVEDQDQLAPIRIRNDQDQRRR
ncbi:hypothetical protein ACUXVY_13485 [Chromobacterium haemolyticum]